MKAVITFVRKAKAVIIVCRRPSPDKKSTRFCKIVARRVHFIVRTWPSAFLHNCLLAKRTSHLFPMLPSANIFRRGREDFLRTRPLTSYAPRIELSPPPQVQAHLGGRNFASCVALGRNFGVTFRSAPRLRAAPPYRLRAEGGETARGGHAIRKVAPKFLPRATQDAKFLPPR